MKIASRFYRQPDIAAGEIDLTVDGEHTIARDGDTVAAALLAQSGDASRHMAQTDAPRTAYCMMGVCFDCLVEVDGQANTQACMTPARDGMVVRRQTGLRSLSIGERNV